MNEYKRVGWIDMARGILFIFVIVCHTFLAPSWIKNIYEPFFLTGFFFLSGYLYKERDPSQKLKSVFNGLFIPFVLFSLIWGGILFVKSKHIMIALYTVAQNLYGGDGIWFIPCLIIVEVFYLLFYVIFRENRNIFVIVISLLGFGVTTSMGFTRGFWCWETAFVGIGFYAFGDICKKFIAIKVYDKRDVVISTILLLMYIVLSLTLGYWGLLSGIDLHLNHYDHHIVFLCIATFGCYSFIRFVRVLPVCSWLEEFGKYTLFLFPFHGIILRNILKFTDKLELSSNIFILLLSLTGTIFLSFFLARFVYKYIPALGGKIKWWK